MLILNWALALERQRNTKEKQAQKLWQRFIKFMVFVWNKTKSLLWDTQNYTKSVNPIKRIYKY